MSENSSHLRRKVIIWGHSIKSLSSDSTNLASKAKQDGRVLYAVINLDPYYQDSANAPFANPENYTESFIHDRAHLAYLYNWEMKNIQEHYGNLLYDPKTPPRDYARMNNLYFYDATKNYRVWASVGWNNIYHVWFKWL